MIKKHTYRHYTHLLPCLVIMLFPWVGRAQTPPPFKKGTDTASIMRLIKTGKSMPNVDSGIVTILKAAQQSTDADFYLGAATALCAAGSRYADQGKYAEATSCATRGLFNAQRAGDVNQVAFCRNLFGVISFFQGDYVAATDHFFKALEGLKKIDSTTYRAAISIYTNLMALSSRMGQKDKALYYMSRGEALARDTTITHGKAYALLAGILTNKGNFFERDHMPDSAVRYYNEVMDVASHLDPASPLHTRFMALTNINMASVCLQTHEYEKAVAYSTAGIAQARDKFAFIATSGMFTQAEALRNLKRYKEAESILLTALKGNAASHTMDESVLGYYTLVKVYKDTRQFEKALQYTDSVKVIEDSLRSAEKTKAVRQVEARYNTAEKDRQITRNELLIAQQQNKIAAKNLWIGGIAALVLLMAALLSGLYFISRQRQQGIIRSLKQQNTISVLKGVVQGEENERIRLARDLHDGIGGMLSATKMRFMALRHEHEDLIASPRYLEAMGLLDIMGDEIRKTSHNLMPEVLLKQDLPEALNTYCNDLRSDTGLNIEFQSFGKFNDLPNDLKLNIYRIIQELLKNILQHASATYAVVQLMMLDAYITITVEDNGRGFDQGGTKDGIGLHNLKARVLSHEGHYTVKSEQGKGTTVYIEFERQVVAASIIPSAKE